MYCFNKYIPEDMPDAAWSRFTGLLNIPDCSADAMGIPDLGEKNVTYPDEKILELRRAYYASISFIKSCCLINCADVPDSISRDNAIVIKYCLDSDINLTSENSMDQ